MGRTLNARGSLATGHISEYAAHFPKNMLWKFMPDMPYSAPSSE